MDPGNKSRGDTENETPHPFSRTPVNPAEAARVLARCYGERAGEEALFRALLAERDLKASQARFWIGVYEGVLVGCHSGEDT